MRLTLFILMIPLLYPISALSAPGEPRGNIRPYQLVCFKAKGLTKILDKIVNPQQFLSNRLGQTVSQRAMSRNGCDYVQIPSGSQAMLNDFHTTPNKFIFPLFRVRYATTRQNMFVADGIFLAESWIRKNNRACGPSWSGPCLVPKTCDTVTRFRGKLPDYVTVPNACKVYTIQ